jgi:hypothetical protein
MMYRAALLAAAAAAVPGPVLAQDAAAPAPTTTPLPARPRLPGDPAPPPPPPSPPSPSPAEPPPPRPTASPALPREPEPPLPASGPPFRFSIGGGGAVLILGSEGERWRGLYQLDLYPGGRLGHWGLSLAARSILFDPYGEAGMVTAGAIYEAAASRPRLIMALHGDLGVTYGPDGGDDVRPVVGGGLKTHLGIIGPLAIATDLTAHLVLGDSDDLALVISAGAMIALFR